MFFPASCFLFPRGPLWRAPGGCQTQWADWPKRRCFASTSMPALFARRQSKRSRRRTHSPGALSCGLAHWGVSGKYRYLIGVLILRESYDLGVYFRGPLFSSTPSGVYALFRGALGSISLDPSRAWAANGTKASECSTTFTRARFASKRPVEPQGGLRVSDFG